MLALRLGRIRILVPAGRSVIGAAGHCLVRLSGNEVRPEHVALVHSVEGLFLEPIDPRHEVQVNGSRLTKLRALAADDRVTVAGTDLMVERDVQVAQPPPAASSDKGATVVALGSLAVHRDIVAALLAQDDELEASRVVAGDLTVLAELAAKGRSVSAEDLAGTAACALELAQRTGEALWIDKLVGVYAAHGATVPAALSRASEALRERLTSAGRAGR